MRIALAAFEAAFNALPAHVTHAEVCADLRDELTLSVSEGAQSDGESFSRTTLYLRAGKEKTGTVLSEKLDDDPYALIEKAVTNAEYSGADTPEPMNGGGHSCDISGGDFAPANEILNAALTLEREAADLPGVAAVHQCSVRRTVYARRVINSLGLDRYTENVSYLATLSLRPRRDGSPPLGTAIARAMKLEDLDLPALAVAALRNADMQDGGGALPPVTLPSGRHRAVLSNAVTRNIMITAWQAFSGAKMLEGASPFDWRTDTAVGSPALSITDNPNPPGYATGFSLDSEGSICTATEIVRQGKLIMPLHTLHSAALAQHPPTGNAGRVAGLSGTTPINLITVPSCIYIEPGTDSPDSLLSQMGDGVYLTYSLDVFHSINIASGDFSIPCGGILYCGGKPVGTVDQLTVAGNLRQLFAGVLAVGDDLSLEEFMFYHNYCYGGPSLLVEGLTFTGRQKEGDA